MDTPAFDTSVRMELYGAIAANGKVPTVSELAAGLGCDQLEVRSALERLHESKAIVLQPESREVLMANPWSAVPTPFLIESAGRTWWGNCIWDVLGIPSALGAPGELKSSCACCGEAMGATVDGGRILSGDGLVHIAVPAKQWWDNIAFT